MTAPAPPPRSPRSPRSSRPSFPSLARLFLRTPRSAGPLPRPPQPARALAAVFSRLTNVLIALCCAVFVIGPASGLNRTYGTGDALLRAQTAYFERWGVVPVELWSGSLRALITPLSALFVHGSWLHLLGNMLFLYVFGGMAEARMGRLPFAAFYLIIGYLALLGYAAAHAASAQTLVGASGSIAGILGAFLYLFPRARVTSVFPFLFFLPLRFPAWVVLLFWFFLQWQAAQDDPNGPGVAYLAHVIGFTLGFLYAWLRYRRDSVGSTSGNVRANEGESQP